MQQKIDIKLSKNKAISSSKRGTNAAEIWVQSVAENGYKVQHKMDIKRSQKLSYFQLKTRYKHS